MLRTKNAGSAKPGPPRKGHVSILLLAVGVVLLGPVPVDAWAQTALRTIRPEDYMPVDRPKEPPRTRAPAELPEPLVEIRDDDTVFVDSLVGVVFLSDPEAVVRTGARGIGVVTEAVEVLDNAKFRARIQPYIGQPLTWRKVDQMVKTTILYFRSQDRPLVDVFVPEQTIDKTTGVLQILVIEGRVGEIRVEGNKWFTEELIRSKVRLKKYDVIHASRLLSDIDYINRNPFRYVRPVLTAGKELGTTDLVLQTEDRIPYRFYIGYEDTGSRLTGLDRYLVGINMGNLFGRDIEFGYQFATNHAFETIGVHSAYLRVPLENRHILALYAYLAHFNARHNELDVQGNAWQISPRYIVPFDPCGRYRHELRGGFDFKRTTNHLDLRGAGVFDRTVDTNQFVLEYAGALDDDMGRTTFTWAGFWSPGSISSKAQKNDYRMTRGGTDPQYFYTNLSMERTWDLPLEMTLVNRVVGQLSTDPLLGNEQLGLGGYNTVRGYDEREVNSDEGLILNVELRSPEFDLGKISGNPALENRLQFLAFWDFGFAHNRTQNVGEDKDTEMQSIGVGLRYRLGTCVTFRLDYGHRLERLSRNGFNDRGRFHIGLLVAY